MTYAEIGQFVTVTTGFLLLGFTGYGVANLRYRVPGTGFFVALTLAGAAWSFGYAFELAQTAVAGFRLAGRLEYLGLAFIPPLWLLMALSWIELPLARSVPFRALLLGLSLVAQGVVWTDDVHHWYYSSIEDTGTKGIAVFHPGPLYYVFFVFYISAFVFSSVVLVLRRRQIVHLRLKALVLVTANLFPVAFATAYAAGLRLAGLDLTFLALIPVFTILAWGLFRHDRIRIVPIARETVVESLEQAVLVFDDKGQLVDNNAAATPLLPGCQEALLLDLGSKGEFTLVLDGQPRTFRFRRSPVRGQGRTEQGSVVLITDITDEKALLDKLAHQATHDELTGVANRRHFEEQALGELTRASRHGGTLALVTFDLDWFKEINDRFGHAAGDTVLRSVTDILIPRLRPYDLFARIGGEEFAVLMPGAQAVEAREAAERWRAALEAAPAFPGSTQPITASFGVSTLNDLPLDLPAAPRGRLDALMGLADKALYRAKTEGRNRVV